MFRATVYKIMIGCPSDIQEEIQIAKEVLYHWNNLYSERDKIVLLPSHWSISSYPIMGKHPQQSINEQVVEKSDLLICIFGSKLGTPTDTEISGTVEEIKEHRKAGKDVMIFFKKSVDDITAVEPQQLQKINDFKDSIKNEALWCEFSNADDFRNELSGKLQLYINKNWIGCMIEDKISTSSIQIEFSETEQNIIIRWTKSRNIYCYRIGVLNGMYYTFGDHNYFVKYGKEEIEYNDFIDRLEKADFIVFDRNDKYKRPIYKLKKEAFDYVDKLGIDNK